MTDAIAATHAELRLAERRVASLEDRVAFVELQACHAINAINAGQIAEAIACLEEVTKGMFEETKT